MLVIDSQSQRPQLVRDLGDGDSVDRVLLVSGTDRCRKRDGSLYLRLTLADRSGTVPAVLWDALDAPALAPGDPVHVTGRVGEHPRYGRQVTIEALRPALQVPWGDLLDGPARPVTELCEDLDGLIASVQDPHLAQLIAALLGRDSPAGRAYREAPAAKYNHHAYRSGLLEHSVQIAQLVDAAAALFGAINRDLAVCGALLHDIGKLEAYAGEHGCADLTDAGKLEGEIPLGYYRVRRATEAIPGFPVELARSLLHVILSHHGCLEHGSPVVPAIREAALVHAIDNLSGQLGAFDRLAKQTAAGERWSRYDHALGTSAFLSGS